MPGQGRESLFENQPDVFVRHLLELHGLSAEPLSVASGWSNGVWIAPDHVVRLSSGRFRDAFAHEVAILRLLPRSAVPHASVRAYGRVGQREWVIQDRIAGSPLVDVWPQLRASERRTAVTQLAEALRALHAIELPAVFVNPWLNDALGPAGHPENAYHAPPTTMACCSTLPREYRVLTRDCSRRWERSLRIGWMLLSVIRWPWSIRTSTLPTCYGTVAKSPLCLTLRERGPPHPTWNWIPCCGSCANRGFIKAGAGNKGHCVKTRCPYQIGSKVLIQSSSLIHV